MLREFHIGPALAVLILFSLGTTTKCARISHSDSGLPERETAYLANRGVSWGGYVPDFVFPKDEGWGQPEISFVPLRSSTSRPQFGQPNLTNKENSPSTSNQESSEEIEETSHTTEDFGYSEMNGPHVWPINFPTCGGIRQSPIDISLQNSVKLPDDVDPAVFLKYYDSPPLQLTLANSGHSVHLTGNWTSKRRPTVSGPILNGEYVLEEIHFHWGEDEMEGSEHFVDGESYPMEMHIVHYKKSYGTIDEARKNEDGLAVVSYLFQIQEEKNHGLQKIIEATKYISDPTSLSININAFSLDKLAPTFSTRYASYLGSLTTPPCSEIVTWIVNLRPLGVSADQIGKLRKLKANDGTRLTQNFRPLQSLNDRVIIYIP